MSIESTHKTKLRTRKTPIVASRITTKSTTSTTCYVKIKYIRTFFVFNESIECMCVPIEKENRG